MVPTSVAQDCPVAGCAAGPGSVGSGAGTRDAPERLGSGRAVTVNRPVGGSTAAPTGVAIAPAASTGGPTSVRTAAADALSGARDSSATAGEDVLRGLGMAAGTDRR